jgi:hypothetical protein
MLAPGDSLIALVEEAEDDKTVEQTRVGDHQLMSSVNRSHRSLCPACPP